MYRYEKVLVCILIGIFGLIPPLAYYSYHRVSLAKPVAFREKIRTNPEQSVLPDMADETDTKQISFRSSSPIEQHAAVITAFVIKPLYTLLALVIAVLLWKRSELELKSLKWAMIFFFAGENFCAANYLFTENHDVHLLEYLHSLGMVLSFGFAAFAVIEWTDRYALHYSDTGRKCSLAGFCRQCAKYEAVSCGLQSVFVYLGFAGAMIALTPLTANLYTVSYNTSIWGTLYNYRHPIVYQLAEVRYYPLLASAMFLAAALVLKLKPHNPLHPAKILFAGAVGAFGFSLFRFMVFQGYRDNLVWMDFWEEITEFIYILGIIVILGYFRRSLFGQQQRINAPQN